jgi:hypothetical protein
VVEIDLLRSYGPTNYEESAMVHQLFARSVQRALTEGTTELIMAALKDVSDWGKWLPLSRLFMNEEIRRLERTANPWIVVRSTNLER